MTTDAKKQQAAWDVIVIGGGPAGMMAAQTAGGRGLRVLLLEKNDTLGKKLLITGGGRCNVTNAEMDSRVFLSKFNTKDEKNDQFLFSAFSQFGVADTFEFFNSHGMETKIEAAKRAFPKTERAQSVWDVLVTRLAETSVTVQSNSPVTGFVKEGDAITGIRLKGGEVLSAHSYILATGGKSRPETGSTGDGFTWLSDLGHRVKEGEAALVPITLSDPWIQKLAGITLASVKISVFQNGMKYDSAKGKLLFTHVGASGPTILNMSADIGELLKYGEVTLSVDLLPDLGPEKLNAKLQGILREHANNKKIKNALGELLPSALSPVVLELAGIDPDTFCHSITREERVALINILKAMPLHVSGLLGLDKAIIASGGVALSEVDFKTMRSRLFPNLYLVGDILDIDRPSGGYSLQLCWTTGFVAGEAAGAPISPRA